ncbi:MAG: SCO family protein [Verrucomicrobiota bacterium]
MRRFETGILPFVIAAAAFLVISCDQPGKMAPQPVVLGKHKLVEPFVLTSHRGEPFASRQLQGKIWVVNFIFTSCGRECPFLSRRFLTLQERFANDERIELVSISVDPQTDTVERLAQYAAGFDAGDRWHFLTGDPGTIARIIRHDFLIDTGKADGTLPQRQNSELPHTERFAVVDRDGIVRFYTNGMAGDAADRTEQAIELILKEPSV